MGLTPDEIREEAWTQFIYARGTSTVFQRRAAYLKRWMQARDFSAIAIPIIIAFVATTDFIEKLGQFKMIALGVLAVAGLIQVLLSSWSLISRWDEERSCLEDLVGFIERRTRRTQSLPVRKAKGIDNHRLDLPWTIIVIELKLQ